MNANGKVINKKALNCSIVDSENGITDIWFALEVDKFHLSAVIPNWRAHADIRLRERDTYTGLLLCLCLH